MKMIKKAKLCFNIVIITTLLTLFSPINFAEPTEQEAKDKLNEISSEEQLIIEKLFVMSSEIELLRTEEVKIEKDIVNINLKIDQLATNINEMELRYATLKTNLAEVLKIQQRKGVGSSIEVIFSSQSLKDFVFRINLLRDLSRKVDDLMSETQSTNAELLKEKSNYENEKENLANQKKELAKKINEKALAKSELEDYLESLNTEKAHYEDYLKSIEALWNSLKPLFSKTIAQFNDLIQSGGLPDDTVTINYSLFNTNGTIYETKFNEVLAKQKEFPVMQFDFKDGAVLLAFPEYEIALEGEFILVDAQTIQYVVSGGTFYQLPMSQSAILDLFSEGDMVFKLKSLLGKNTIKKIDQYEDRIVMQISISLF
ncbi:coiled-coil domain-containing protein [Fusibacter bizertensis]